MKSIFCDVYIISILPIEFSQYYNQFLHLNQIVYNLQTFLLSSPDKTNSSGDCLLTDESFVFHKVFTFHPRRQILKYMAENIFIQKKDITLTCIELKDKDER